MSTRVLLICAAVGVATGLVSAGAGYLSIPVSAAAPVLYGLVLGSHVLPGIVAQSLLRTPGVALIAHVLAALISSAFAPAWVLRYIGTALLIGVVQEGITALGRYRYWGMGRFLVSAVIVGVLLAVPIGFAADVDKFAPWAFVLYLAMFIVGPVVWTFIGVRVGVALRRAGLVTRA
ncbi:hypothetical protein GCM10025863_22600 [Microbacterium suwonense]|uniref:Acyl esterase n=2 Tax=Microbacterium suwonense TaxID=683047 RepID=A0ABN6X8D5_9MICO|nr:hypothetical protein GCM10025863_22600 [Microbacterium suwonense]